MCLVVKRRSTIHSQEELNTLVKTTKRNKTVYKAFRVKKTGNKIRLFAPYRNSEYHLDQKYTSQIDIKNDYSWSGACITVEKGLHAFRQLEGDMRNMKNNDWYAIIPCIIPTGAKYVIGKDNEIASSELILPDNFIYKGEEYNINY